MKRGYLFLIGILSLIGALAVGWFGKNAYERQVLTARLPVPRQVIEEIIDIAKGAGVDKVGLMTEQIKAQ